MRLPNVAIMGRPNVGKSTLFNRIIRRRDAIVDSTPGVTRDRKHAEAEWAGAHFILVDTGGYISQSSETIDTAVVQQLSEAMEEADVIVFIVDGRSGLVAEDQNIAEIIRLSGKPVILVVNKIDDETIEGGTTDFYQLGFGEPISISATTGRKVGDFLDEVIALFPEKISANEKSDDNVLRLAVVGRPNVGKSSYINAVLGTPKLIVTDVPGTTRDSIDTTFRYKNHKIVLVDTAGLRRKSKVTESVEYFSTQRALNSLKRAHVVILMIDADGGLYDQDRKIIDQITNNRKGIILAINKWDVIDKDSITAQKFEKIFRERLGTTNYFPMLFISALEKQRIFKVLDVAISVNEERNKIVRNRELNKFLEDVTTHHVPPAFGRKQIKIKYCAQVSSSPPVFAFYCNDPRGITTNYKQYLENQLRQQFGFFGVPLTLSFRKK